MRKILVMAAILSLAAATAFAYGPGYGRGQGAPCGGPGFGAGAQGAPCGGPGFGRGFGPGFNGGEDFKAIDDAGAKAKIQEYLDTNLKGFKIVDSEKYERPRGSMYRFEVQDSNSNAFVFMVNPFGYVRGPIPVQNIK